MAVYTKVSDAEISAFLRAYDIGALQELHGIKQGVENSNYLLVTTQAKYILTLYEKRTRREDLPFFLGLMEHVARKDIPAPQPVRAQSGEMLQELAGKPAAITSFLNGKMTPRITAIECFELGKALAAFHLAAADFNLQRPNALSLDGWQKLVDACLPRADEVEPGLAATLSHEMETLRAGWPKAGTLPFGVIHADLFPDNVFFDGERLCGLIDFYFACNDFWAYDLAICMNAWCFENRASFNITKAGALIRGYNTVRPLSEAEVNALPLFARGSALRFLLTRLYDWLNQVPGALVKPKDPMDYASRLVFHQMVSGVTDYGLAA